MATRKSTKSLLDQDTHTIELTPGQLIIAISGLMFVALLCFAAGILVNKYDLSRHGMGAAEAAASSPITAAPGRDPARPAQNSGAGQQTSPRVTTAGDTDPLKARNDRLERLAAKTPRTVELAPPAPKPATAATAGQSALPSTGATPSNISAQPASKPADTAAVNIHEPPARLDPPPVPPVRPNAAGAASTAGSGSPPPAKEEPKAQTPAPGPPAQPVQLAKAPEAAPAPAPGAEDAPLESLGGPAVSSSAPASGGPVYTIQLAAYKKENRAQAEQYIKTLKKNAQIEPFLDDKGAGDYIRVFYGRFPAREAAQAELDKLKTKADFKDCWVRPLN